MIRAAARVLLGALVVALAVGTLGGCGETDRAREEIDRARAEVERRADEVRDDLRERRDRLRARIERILGQIEQVIPRARTTSPAVRTGGRAETPAIDDFLTDVLRSVDRYWTRTLRENGLPEPRVSYAWIPEGVPTRTGCQVLADDSAAFYCPADDTIYMAERFASDLFAGVARGLPGESSGYGRAAGDFGVAYVVAHEYAHNLQDELDLFTIRGANSSRPFELQADCLAGVWGNSVYEDGLLKPGDVQEAMNTALAVGDFDRTNANHHGTPEERRDAWLGGFRSGDPSSCRRYVPGS